MGVVRRASAFQHHLIFHSFFLPLFISLYLFIFFLPCLVISVRVSWLDFISEDPWNCELAPDDVESEPSPAA